MKARKTILLKAAVTLLLIPGAVVMAQDINSPIHMPNSVMNKVTHFRLMGITAKARAEKAQKTIRNEALDDAQGTIQGGNVAFDANSMIPGGGGCSVDIGNVGSTGLTGSADREVVIVGDVINVCN